MKGHHGFDQAIAITGLFRGHNSEHGGSHGQAEQFSNLAWITAGTVTKWGATYNYLTLGEYKYTNAIQHEMSHNWGADHDDEDYNVMYPTACDDEKCATWRPLGIEAINSNINWFSNLPFF
jgi:hypothetical protein